MPTFKKSISLSGSAYVLVRVILYKGVLGEGLRLPPSLQATVIFEDGIFCCFTNFFFQNIKI